MLLSTMKLSASSQSGIWDVLLSYGLLSVATVASSIGYIFTLTFAVNFISLLQFNGCSQYRWFFPIFQLKICHADMHLSYPLRPGVEILNNSVGSSKTFSKEMLLKELLLKSCTDPKTRRVWIATSCSSVQATSALDAVSGRLVQDAWTI
ncbi:hypothetical protein Peur_035392 [Populus x canadensis]